MHPKEVELIKKNASRYAKEVYNTDHPTPEQIQGALSMLANTAQNLADYNFGYDVPYSAQAEAFLYILQSEYVATNPSLSIGNGQFLFYATNDQKTSPYINSGYVDKEIAGVIIKAPIRQPEIAGANKIKRDPATNLPLDDEGRYAQQISVNGKMHAPKYFPCPRASAGCGGQNLDMSDPGTAAYVKALDQKILNDIGDRATLVVIANPVGAGGIVAGYVGLLTSVIGGFVEETLATTGSKEIVARAAQEYLKNVLKIPAAAASQVTALVDLAGGWQTFLNRIQKEGINTQGEAK